MWTEEKMAFKCKGVDWHVKPAHCCPVSFRKCRINESSLSFFQLAVAFSRDGMCFPPFQCAFQLKAISFRKTYCNRAYPDCSFFHLSPVFVFLRFSGSDHYACLPDYDGHLSYGIIAYCSFLL